MELKEIEEQIKKEFSELQSFEINKIKLILTLSLSDYNSGVSSITAFGLCFSLDDSGCKVVLEKEEGVLTKESLFLKWKLVKMLLGIIKLIAPFYGGNIAKSYYWTKGEKAPRIQVLENLIKLI